MVGLENRQDGCDRLIPDTGEGNDVQGKPQLLMECLVPILDCRTMLDTS